jgi:lipopolysaccharide export system protein LptA
MMRRRKFCGALWSLPAAAVALLVVVSDTHAQAARPSAPAASPSPIAPQGPPNALQGFSQNRGQPVQIEAATLEVRDKDKMATFTGNVHVIQGDTDMRCRTLVVFYEDSSAPIVAAPAATPADGAQAPAAKPAVKTSMPGPGGSSKIKRLEANGNVVVAQKEQTATGDKGIFDMRANTVTLIGNVVMSQGQDVLRGERLVVDLTTGVSHVEGGRVHGLFQRSGQGEDSKRPPKLPGTN